MQSSNFTINFAITDEASNKVKCDGNINYYGLDYQQVLFVEDKLLGAFQTMNTEAAKLTAG